MKLLVVWLINAIALMAVAYLLPGIAVSSFVVALVAALVLGLVNAVIRPVLILLTLPATLLTLGLFIFVINGLLFWFVGSFVAGFAVNGFWPGVFGAIGYSIVSWALSAAAAQYQVVLKDQLLDPRERGAAVRHHAAARRIGCGRGGSRRGEAGGAPRAAADRRRRGLRHPG